VLISVAVGLVLAVAYHLLSGRLQMWASKQRVTMLPLVAVLGFMVRLAVVAAILVAIGLWSPLNILAVCLAFIVVFTILNGILLYRMAVRSKNTPSSSGTDGAE
jgi:ABC-type transport system involved in Fe-S cluster assembly fused permease/ATPase subunit